MILIDQRAHLKLSLENHIFVIVELSTPDLQWLLVILHVFISAYYFTDQEFENQGDLMDIVQGLNENDEAPLLNFEVELKRKRENAISGRDQEMMDCTETSTLPTRYILLYLSTHQLAVS